MLFHELMRFACCHPFISVFVIGAIAARVLR